MRCRYGLIMLVVLVCGCATLPNRFDPAPVPGSQAVVFDIDGTLTPTPLRFWQPREHAAVAVRGFADAGYQVFYVTARVRMLQAPIPGWLEGHGFPRGALFLTETAADRDDHAAFKTRILRQLQQQGWRLEWAFGDSTSDASAYRAAGIPADRIVGLQRQCEDACEPGEWARCLPDWGAWSLQPRAGHQHRRGGAQ